MWVLRQYIRIRIHGLWLCMGADSTGRSTRPDMPTLSGGGGAGIFVVGGWLVGEERWGCITSAWVLNKVLRDNIRKKVYVVTLYHGFKDRHIIVPSVRLG